MQDEDYFVLAAIRHRFGYVPAQVSQALLNSSQQTIEKLIKTTNLPHESIAAALTLLLQHDIVSCNGPYDISRPPRANMARSRLKKDDADATQNAYSAYEHTTSLEQFGDINTRLYGNTASGYCLDSGLSINAVYQPVLATEIIEYDDPRNAASAVTNYQYSINRGMARGLSRAPFYCGLILELFNQDCRYFIDEFVFRGKLTIPKAMEYTLERMVAEDDAILRDKHKELNGADPNYTVDDFNAMSTAHLETLSIWAFNRARLMADRNVKNEIKMNNISGEGKQKNNKRQNSDFIGGISASILQEMDNIELSRYESLVDRVVKAVQCINQYFLLVESPGFLDHSIVTNTTILFPSELPPITQPLDGIEPIESGGLSTELNIKKRKLKELAVEDFIYPTLTTAPSTSSNNTTNTNNNNTTTTTTTSTKLHIYDDDDDLFDPAPSTNDTNTFQLKRIRPNKSFSATDQANQQPLLSVGPRQSPLSRDQQLYILNHDRFTLILRGEIYHDFISKKVGITAGLIIGAINFDSLTHENPSLYGEYTIPMIQAALERYCDLKRKHHNPNQFTETVLASLPKLQIINTTGNLKDFTTPLQALQYTLVNGQLPLNLIQTALNKLSYNHSNNNNNDSVAHEQQYMFTCSPSSQTLRTTGLIVQQNRTIGNDNTKNDDILNLAYQIQYHKIAQSIRKEYLLTHMYTKFGSPGRRVVATLMDHSRLEEKQISDFSLVPKREVKEILHTCLQEGILDILDVPTSSDRLNPAKVFYLWGIDYVLGGKKMLNIFYKSYANTLLRLDVQRDQSTQYIDKMLLQKHYEITDLEAITGRDYKLTFARLMHVLSGTMKAIVIFKDLCPR